MFNSARLNILHPQNDLYHCSCSHTIPYATNPGHKISGPTLVSVYYAKATRNLHQLLGGHYRVGEMHQK